jgi:GTP-binding protein
MYPTVALVGKPNTGKSTLFNRLVGSKVSITYNQSGTTRDRILKLVTFNDIPTLLVDTAGLDSEKFEDDLENDVQKQSEVAIQEADVILFVVDTTTDLTQGDFKVAETLRKSKKKVILVGSKADDEVVDEFGSNLYVLGFDAPMRVSAVHNLGVTELIEVIGKTLKSLKFSKFKSKKPPENQINISFVGRPNVGKSSLINAIFGKDQVVVSETPGTTRDSVSLMFDYEDKNFMLTDTAGIRRSGKLRKEWLEKYSVLRSLKAIESSDVCVLVLDSFEKLAKQDMRVSEFILDAKKGLIIVLNKADLVKPEEKNYLLALLRNKMPYAHFAPVIFTSALKGRNVLEVLSQAVAINEERKKQVKTKDINYFLERTVADHPPKSGIKFKFVDQVDTRPPTFLFFVNKPEDLHFSYKRYLENAIRQEYGFSGTAIEMKFKGKAIEELSKRDKEKLFQNKVRKKRKLGRKGRI